MLILEIALGVILGGLGLAMLYAWPHIIAAGTAVIVTGAFCVFSPKFAAVYACLAIPCAIGLWLHEKSLNRAPDGAPHVDDIDQRGKAGALP